MLESINSTNLEYKKLSAEEMQQRGILGRLVGVCADFMAPTRNGRRYGQELWEKVFSDPIMKERIENGVCFGELNHPLDGREETDIQKAAVCLAEVPKKGKDGKLRAVFDILATPAGKILKTLCDYGSTLGVSSRGSGDLITDYDGQEAVDPSTYTCEGFDIVTIPAVKEARLQYVTEAFNQNNKKSLNESLTDLINAASDADKAVMTETLSNLGFELTESKLNEDTSINVDYNKLANDAKHLLSGDYGFITNNKDLEAALKKAIDNNASADIMQIAKLLQKYDPDFIKAHKKVDDLAAEPVKQTDNLDLNTVLDADSTLSSEPSIDSTEMEAEPAGQNQEEKTVYNNDENNIEESLQESADLTIEQLQSLSAELENLGYKSFEAFSKDFENWKNQQQQQNVADDNIDEVNESIEVDNSKSNMINTLQEALIGKQNAESETLKLNEKLSVCYAKEAKQEDEIQSLNESIVSLKDSVKQLTEEKVESAKEVKQLENRASKQAAMLTEANASIRSLNGKCQDIVEKYNSLAERYNKNQTNIRSLNETLNKQSESIKSLEKEKTQLSEELKKAQKESKVQQESYSNKLSESNKLVEKYKGVATRAINKYIESQALKIGVSSNEIKNKLPANYSFNDIDRICESLSATKVSMNMLPFRNPTKLKENMSIEIKEQKEPILGNTKYNVDDEIDDSLKLLAKM